MPVDLFDGKFVLDVQVFDSMQALLAHYSKHNIVYGGRDIGSLQFPVHQAGR